MTTGDFRNAWIRASFHQTDGLGDDSLVIVTGLTSPTIPDLSFVHMDLMGSYSFEDEYEGSPRTGRFHIQVTARRYDGDGVAQQQGLAILDHQSLYDGFAGYEPQVDVDSNTIVVKVTDNSDGVALFFDFEVKGRIREATIDQPTGGG